MSSCLLSDRYGVKFVSAAVTCNKFCKRNSCSATNLEQSPLNKHRRSCEGSIFWERIWFSSRIALLPPPDPIRSKKGGYPASCGHLRVSPYQIFQAIYIYIYNGFARAVRPPKGHQNQNYSTSQPLVSKFQELPV